jgi:hypothetical protein
VYIFFSMFPRPSPNTTRRAEYAIFSKRLSLSRLEKRPREARPRMPRAARTPRVEEARAARMLPPLLFLSESPFLVFYCPPRL